MRIVLVRHAAVEPDPALPSAWWPLSDAGRAGARELARWPGWRRIEQIYASPALSAHETAQIVAGRNGINVTLVEDLREVARPTGQWHAYYPAAVREYLARPVEGAHGWEPPAAATARVAACLEELAAAERTPFAVVGHGLALSLYLARLSGADPAAIWPGIALPDLAIMDPDRLALVRPFGAWRAARGTTDGRRSTKVSERNPR